MAEQNPIAKNTVISFHYNLVDNDGQELDSSLGKAPLTYIQGSGQIVPGLDQAMLGHQAGDKFQVVVQPEDAYGVRDESGVKVIPPSAFGEFAPVVGMQLATRTPDGDIVPFWIKAVTDTGITIDFNHPLAGTVLNFDVEIVSTREATEEEIAHGHIHGMGGCGGCGGCHSESGCGGCGGCEG